MAVRLEVALAALALSRNGVLSGRPTTAASKRRSPGRRRRSSSPPGASGAARAWAWSRPSTERERRAMADARSSRTAGRRHHRHRRRLLARRRARRQLGGADRRPLRHPPHHAASRSTHLRTTIAGTIDYLRSRPQELDARAPASSPATRRSPCPASAARAISRDRCSSPSRRSRSNGRRGGASTMSSDPAVGDAYDRMISVAARSQRPIREFEQLMYGHVGEKLAERFGTKGAPISLTTACASGATAIQLGVEAIRRGETDAALCIGTDCSVTAEDVIRFSLLSALSNANDDPRGGVQALLQEPRRLRHRRGRGGAGARGLRRRAWPAAPRSWRSSAAPPRRPTISTARARSRTARRSSPRSARPSTTPA